MLAQHCSSSSYRRLLMHESHYSPLEESEDLPPEAHAYTQLNRSSETRCLNSHSLSPHLSHPLLISSQLHFTLGLLASASPVSFYVNTALPIFPHQILSFPMTCRATLSAFGAKKWWLRVGSRFWCVRGPTSQSLFGPKDLLRQSVLLYFHPTAICTAKDDGFLRVTTVASGMLINSEIWTLVEQEVSAFQTLQLYDTNIVIHAHDFLSNVLRMSDQHLRYGGDYLQIEEDLVRALGSFSQCNIRPIFIFGGASTLKASRLQENIRCLQRRTSILESDLQQDHASNLIWEPDHRNGLFCTPVFAKEALVKKLDAMDFLHVTCDADTVSACVALAAYLRCPLVANSNELFLFELEEPSVCLERFIYVPLKFLSSQPVPHSSNLHSLCLVAHAFSPSNSSIHRVPYALRPFFAIYFKPPNGSYFPLPYRLYSDLSDRKNSDSKDSVRPMVKRAVELVNWLESIDSPINAFDESVKRLERSAISLFIKELVEITSALKIDLRQGEGLARYLFPDVKPRKQELIISADLITYLTQESSFLEQIKQYVSVNEIEGNLAKCGMANFLSKVPPGFLQLYRSGFLSTVVFTRILSNIVVLPVLKEDPARDSAMECSIGVRYLQYCLAFDFVRRYGMEVVPISGFAEPTILEFSRSKDVSLYRRRMLTLRPSHLSTSEDPTKACASFVYKNVGYQMKSVGNWVEMLALTLTLWHVSTHPGVKFNILNQTTALAVALIVCAVEASNGDLNFRLLNELADGMACDYNVDVVHEINELQLFYISMLSLLRLVNALIVCEGVNKENPEILSFPLGGRIFPSSRLIHNLAVTLKGSQDRESLNIWLERLLSPIQNAEYVKQATESMVYLARTLCEMWVMRPIEFSSQCELLPFSSSRNPFSDSGDHEGKNGTSPSQRMRPCSHESDLRNGRDGVHASCSSTHRLDRSRPNDKAFAQNVGSCEPSGKSANSLGIKSTINSATNYEKILQNKEEPRFMQGVSNNSHRKWGRSFDFYPKMGPGRPFRPRGSGFGNENESKRRSTNPFLPDYIPQLDPNRRSSPPNVIKLGNPLSDFDPSCEHPASECCEIQDSSQVNHLPYSRQRESVTLPASEHGFRMYRGNCLRSTISKSGDEFLNRNNRADNYSVVGEKVSPTPSYGRNNATETMVRVNSRGYCRDASYKRGKGTSRFKGSDPENGTLGPRAPFNRNNPFGSPRNNGNMFRIDRGKQFRSFNGFSRHGSAFNGGSYANRPLQGRCSNLNKQEWDPDEIADAVEKLALEFS
ncbi:hypothetical protein TcWFU_007059 [Taenia crassiceps]|uniref:Uncharacterized protein n=1 Tax=Taenia crassiceps TaxID=6207 RepID=A0ABR4QEU3_9CEST